MPTELTGMPGLFVTIMKKNRVETIELYLIVYFTWSLDLQSVIKVHLTCLVFQEDNISLSSFYDDADTVSLGAFSMKDPLD